MSKNTFKSRNELNIQDNENVKEYFETGYSVNSNEKIKEERNISRAYKYNYTDNRTNRKKLSRAISRIFIILFIIIALITITLGIIMFFVTMPGMSMDRLNQLSEKIGIDIDKMFNNGSVEVKDQDIYDIMDYLVGMGYDLKSFGFLTDNSDRYEDNTLKDDIDDGLILHTDEDKKGKIKEAESDFILYYLISDNYLYGLSSDTGSDGKKGIPGVINKIHGDRIELWERIKELVNKEDNWGAGLLGLYIDDGYGVKGSQSYNSLDWADAKFDFEKKTLSIKRTYGSDKMTYNITGWTGKYGMPIELLVATHLATLMPDLSYDLATGFDTEIDILLHNEGNSGLYYQDDGGNYISIELIRIAAYGTNAQKIEAGVFNSEDERKNLLEPIYGSDWSNVKVNLIMGQALAQSIAETAGRARGGGKYDVYMARIENHWFRDIYYMINNSNTKLLDFDENYEDKVRDRLTLYETYTENVSEYGNSHIGEFILYEIDEHGNYKKDSNGNFIMFEGTLGDATAQNIRVSKRAKGVSNSRLEDFGWNDSEIGIWSAYEEKSGTPNYINAFENPAEGSLEARIFALVPTGGGLVQKGDALRGETNAKIKNMFTTNTYFRYDGSVTTANIINELRKKANLDYGAIDTNSSKYNEEIELSDGNKYKISDFTGEVSTSQDLLNIFNMLENTHTIDANNVYRDLKELSVELGYYDKEEVTDETPKILQFIVPQIGSYEYPKRELDKNEHEYGTMLHAKADFEAYETTREIVDETKEDEENVGLNSEKGSLKSNVDLAIDENKTNIIDDFDLNLATNNFDRSDSSLRKEYIKKLEEAYYSEGYDGSIDASPYDPSDPRYEGTQGSLYREYISIMREKKPDFYLANNINKDEIYGDSINNNISLLGSLSNTVIGVQGEKRKLLGGFDSELGQIIVSDFEESEDWDDVLSIVMAQNNEIDIGNVPYGSGDKNGYENWLRSLGGVFADYAGEDMKMGGETLEDFVNANKYVYGLFSIIGFEYCNGDLSHCGAFMEGHTGLHVPSDFDAFRGRGEHSFHVSYRKMDECMVNHHFLTNCNYTTDKVYHKAGLFGGEGQPDASCAYISLVENFGAQIIFDPSELQVGDLVECFESNGGNSPNPHDWSGWHHVMFVGEVTDDEIVFHTTGHDYTSDGHFVLKISKDETRNGNWYPNNTHPGWVGLHMYEFESSGLYEGYKGNEAVVSPVTGVLLEYGTYDDEKMDLDGKVEEEYRVNVDLLYDANHVGVKNLGIGETEVHDKVGYAKILVLDAENYQKLESYTNNKWKSNSLIEITDNGTYKYRDDLFDKDKEKEMSQINKTVYGYKEFVETYDKYDISGYIVYIDGFACELPGRKKEDGTVEVEDEDKLSMNYFRDKARKRDSSSEFECKIKNRYKTDKSYGSINNDLTEQFKAERAVKKDAESAVYLDINKNDKILLIKEGTVIGRTYTNQEIFYMRQENPEASDMMSKIKLSDDGLESVAVLDSEKESPVVQGNYLRTIMIDRNGDIVENVEDYMKLNSRPSSKLFDKMNLKPIEASEEEINLMASVMQTVSVSPEEFKAVAWVIRNRYTAGTYGDSIRKIIESGGGMFPHSQSPSAEAVDIAKKVLAGEIQSPIADRCYYTKYNPLEHITQTVNAFASPVQVVENGNIFHYDVSNIRQDPLPNEN